MDDRIINGMRFEVKRLDDAWEVRTWKSNGVTERSVRPALEWVEVFKQVDVDHPDPSYHYPEWDDRPALDPIEDAALIAERRVHALQKSASRAKTMCRHTIISEGFNEMLTITYRENQTDRELCKAHLKEWVRRMKKALGGFRYCAAFETQERGAMHVHVATHKMPQFGKYKGTKIKTWQLGTKIWRDIVGQDNGMVFVGGKPSKWGSKARKNMSLYKMASYVSKYIMKDFASAPSESNRYSRSNGVEVSEVHKMRLYGSLADIVAVTFECMPGDVLYSHNVGRFKDSYWLATEAKTRPLLPVVV